MARDLGSEPATQRLFVAFPISSAQLDAVARAIEPWKAELPGLRWVPRENQHVTVKFLGSTSPRLMTWVAEVVASVAATHAPMKTSFAGLGAFPSSRKARVLWAGLDDAGGRMAEVALALNHVLSSEFEPETRAYTPHLTLARSDPAAVLPEAFAGTSLESGAFVLDLLVLFRSHIRRPAPRYERLGEFVLTG